MCGVVCVCVSPSAGPPSAKPPKKSLSFFPSPAPILVLFLSLGVFSWNFGVVLKRRDPQMCTFGVLGLSCEAPSAGLNRSDGPNSVEPISVTKEGLSRPGLNRSRPTGRGVGRGEGVELAEVELTFTSTHNSTKTKIIGMFLLTCFFFFFPPPDRPPPDRAPPDRLPPDRPLLDPLRRTAKHFSLFLSPATIFILSSLSWGSFRGIVEVFLKSRVWKLFSKIKKLCVYFPRTRRS